MERKIGDVFKYKGVKLKVEEIPFCENCYFKADYKSKCVFQSFTKVTGPCEHLLRSDRKSVSFVKVE